MLVVDEILNPQIEHALSLLDIPDPRRLIAGARDEKPAVPREVERVNFLHVPLKEMPDALLLDIPDLQAGGS